MVDDATPGTMYCMEAPPHMAPQLPPMHGLSVGLHTHCVGVDMAFPNCTDTLPIAGNAGTRRASLQASETQRGSGVPVYRGSMPVWEVPDRHDHQVHYTICFTLYVVYGILHFTSLCITIPYSYYYLLCGIYSRYVQVVVDTFVRDYLSVGRPVLIPGAVSVGAAAAYVVQQHNTTCNDTPVNIYCVCQVLVPRSTAVVAAHCDGYSVA